MLEEMMRPAWGEIKGLKARPVPAIQRGTVVSVSPLLVQLDGDLDTDGLPVDSPALSVATVDVGDRVECVKQNRRVRIITAPRPGPGPGDDRFVFVSDFGAKGDGSTDDTAAFQAAANALANGGELRLDRGSVYWLSGAVILHSGTVVNGQGSQIRKLAGSVNRCTFVNKSAANAKGYGAGGRNITIRDVHFRGDYSIPPANYKDMALAFHHVQGLLIENCVFEEAMHNSHYIDLLGCTDVVIRSNIFKGCRPITGRNYIEAIQLDFSRRSAASYDDEVLSSYDGLPCRNVLVEGNTFTTLTIGATTYAMPRPVGMHGAGSLTTNNGIPENFRVIGNHFEGYINPITSGDYGWLNFPGTRGVVISGNTFRCTGGDSAAFGAIIAGYSITTVVPLAEVANSPAGTVTLGSARVIDGWTISDNTFLDFHLGSTTTTHGLIDVRGTTASQVTIQGNMVQNSAVTPIRAQGCLVTITGNNLYSSYEGIRSVDGRAHVTGNTVTVNASSSQPIVLSGGSQHVVVGNYTTGGDNGIRVQNVNNGIIEANFVSDYYANGIVVGANGDSGASFDCTVAGNRIRSSNGPSSSIHLGTNSTRTMRYGNRYWDGGPIVDNGAGTITSAADANAADGGDTGREHGAASLASQSLASSGVFSTLALSAVRTAGGVTFGSNRFTVTEPGLYLVEFSVRFPASWSGNLSAQVYVSGVSTGVMIRENANSITTLTTEYSSAGTLLLSAGDTVYLAAWQNSGNTASLDTGRLTITRISP